MNVKMAVRSGVHDGRRRLATARSTHRQPAVDRGQWLSWPAHIVSYMTKLANLRTAP
jgi:hypothetical protein